MSTPCRSMAIRSVPPAIRISRIRSKSPPSSPTCSWTRRRSPSRCCTTRSRTPTRPAPEIDELFGPDIGKLVEGLTKIKKLDLVSKKAEQAENLRKLLLAISEDVRVLLVKLADRLHNMRTLDHMPRGQAPAHRRGDDGDLCAARRPHGHAGHARGAGGARLPLRQPGGLPHRHRAAGRDLREATAASSARSRRRCPSCSRSTASRPR